MEASARLGTVRAVLQCSLPSLLGPERLGDLSNDPEAASQYWSWLSLSSARFFDRCILFGCGVDKCRWVEWGGKCSMRALGVASAKPRCKISRPNYLTDCTVCEVIQVD